MGREKITEEVERRLKELGKEVKKVLGEVEKELEAVRDSLVQRREDAVTQGLARLRKARSILESLRRRVRLGGVELRTLLAKARVSAAGDPKLMVEIEELGERVETAVDAWEDLIDDTLDDVKDLISSLKRARRGRHRVVGIDTMLDRSIRLAAASLESSIESLIRGFEEALKRLERMGGPTRVVSSIRLPESDLELIDLLVEAGAFKSRSEAVAYFTHKGIEASKPALEQLLAKLKEFKELRDKVREEIRRALGEEKEEES